jgi:hypothetical protein
MPVRLCILAKELPDLECHVSGSNGMPGVFSFASAFSRLLGQGMKRVHALVEWTREHPSHGMTEGGE